jgi:hypothetical protein
MLFNFNFSIEKIIPTYIAANKLGGTDTVIISKNLIKISILVH